jgi:hypothetical protein
MYALLPLLLMEAIMPYAEAEYAVQKIWDNHYRIHKFDGHHGSYLGSYNVKKLKTGTWDCDCVAQGSCKHILMVMKEINPKKDLF